ncbi:RNA-directed DNA methylation 4 [Dorcoceras hygrometricum]|uniref:RNA-directed DNA methylation 4 n=1 Tax=Dorcoceras hygrometricum TaxID=472368 RepID=A0A2Z7A5P3_9LAMI|nr:RNA-directed DNA methylation 4 [Dorcoceras hygrometricum]
MASFTVNALQVNFESVLSMDNAGMVKMFKSLEELGLRVFLGASGSVFEGALTEFFANATFIAETIVSTMAKMKIVITKDVFAEMFHLTIDWIVSFYGLSIKAVADVKVLFSGTDVSFRPSNKKKDMKVEYRLLHDIVAKYLSVKESWGVRGVASTQEETKDEEAKYSQAYPSCGGAGYSIEFPIVVRTEPEQPGQQSTAYGGGMVFAPMIREINWATHFLPKIDPTTKGKEILEVFAQPIPIEEHCLLVIQAAWEAVSLKMSSYDEWTRFRTEWFEIIKSAHNCEPDQREAVPTALRAGPDYQQLCELV